MKRNYTHISVILDRTGSMESIRDDTIAGFNRFLNEQKKQPGTATLTLVQFDSGDPYEIIHDFKPIKEVRPLTRKTYVPRASTPLLDAIGRGINDLEKRIGDLPEAARPSKVVVAIVTDGQENASREFTREQIDKMIKERTENDNWQFVFLAADLGAIDDATAVGIDPDAILFFGKDKKSVKSAWSTLSIQTTHYRRARKRKIGFARRDREQANRPKSKK